MKIAIIGDSSMLYMPYINNYEKILSNDKVNFTIINWDRFKIEHNNEMKFRDKKNGHRRNYFDYLRYSKFVKKRISEGHYDKIIVCGIPIAHLLRKYLLKNYKGKYVIDIRDYHKILKIIKINKLINNSSFTVISSYGYKIWLPKSTKYIINHNTQVDNLEELRPSNIKYNNEKINVAFIGAIRDYGVNIKLIDSLRNNKNIELFFHGEGVINKDISKYIDNNVNNVYITGKYYKENEENLYFKSDLINALIPNNDINSKTLLPNRLYNSTLYGKPMIALEGTYLAKLIEKYKLGLVLQSFDKVEEKIKAYLKEFDRCEYEKGRIDFFNNVMKDNEYFKVKLQEFVEYKN